MSVWTDRDLPVLQALATSEDENVRQGFLMVASGHGGEQLGVDLDDPVIHDSLLTLADAGYLDFELRYESGPGALFTHLAVTGAGLQALGEWPLFDAATSPETIALLLEHLAPEAPTDEETTSMQQAADYVRSMAPGTFRALASGVIGAVLRAHLGL